MHSQEPKKSQRKVYIPIKIQTNAIKNDDIAINASYISIEDLTSEEDRRRARERAKNTEVRYLESIRNKIKSFYSCNRDHCPAIRERLQHHLLEYHSSIPLQGQSQTVTISPKPSILKRTVNQKLTEHESIQTIPLEDLKDTTQNNIIGLFNSDDHTNHDNLESTTECKPIKNKISFINRHCVMKNDLQDEIMKWYKDIPLYANVSLSVENLRQQLIIEFIEKLYEHTNKENNEDDYENIIKREIDDFLNALPMWCPGTRESQELLKDKMKNDLMISIKNLRSKLYYLTVSFQTDGPVESKPYTIASNDFQNENINKQFENEITDWLMQIKFKESDDIGKTMSLLDTADIFYRRLLPFLNKSACTRHHKLVLKSLILNTLYSLPNIFQYPKNKRLYFNRLAEELTNRLVYIQVKYMNSNSCCDYPKDRNIIRVTVNSNSDDKRSSFEGLDSNISNINFHPHSSVFEDVAEILFDYIESISFENAQTSNEANNDNSKKIEAIKDAIVRDVTKDILQNAQYSNIATNTSFIISPISVFKSEQDLFGQSNFPVTSTPKRIRTKKEIIKQNPEEIAYTKSVSEIVQTWMETLPKNFNDDKKFKDIVISDLVGDIVDQIKMQQLVPVDELDNNKLMYYIIFRWLYRFDIFEDELSEDIPQIKDLQKQLRQISIPNLIRPRHGNRQIMANTKFKELENEFFVPSGMDVLEDEISIWMNEQPSHIYSTEDKAGRDLMVKELAKSLQSHLVKKSEEKEIKTDINIWLKKVLNSSAKKDIDNLTETLKNRIIKLPQDDTLAKILEVKIQRKLQSEATRLNPVQVSIANEIAVAQPNIDTDETIKEFITKYIEHNYDIDDTVARAAFGELLKSEIRKLSPPTRQEVYDNFTKPYDKLSPDRLDKELQYIKIVSDWLKNIPIENSFNTPHNKKRIEIVNDVARNIYEVEEERSRAPTAMDYEMYLASIISQFTNILPIPLEHRGQVMFMIDELIRKVLSVRTPITCCSNTNHLNSTNTSGIPENDICELIHSYIHSKSTELSDDQMKLDAWSARLMKEVKKIVQSTADPSTLCKAQVYDKLLATPTPGHESVRIFSLELDYVKEISDWLKNLPLLPLQSQETNEKKIKMIIELAEKFSEWEKRMLINSSDHPNNLEVNEYVTSWIRRLPLNSNKQLDMPILISQLLKRIEKINKGSIDAIFQPNISESYTSSKKSKSTLNKKRSKNKKCVSPCCSSGKGTVGKVIVDAIENWSKNLPIKSDSKDADMSIKDDIARKLYQKIGDLSVDPQVIKDNDLFQELFADEVDLQLSKITQHQDVQKKYNVLKNELIDKVMEGKSIVEEAFAGENYKLQLENTIECSLPNPKINNNQWYDPTFEIYKNRLADKFILDNFDHGNDAVKSKYDRKIREEIDKYFQSVQNRNAIPLSKGEIYNELYSALFKVPIPNEASAIAEVEEVKTRCEIDLWFEGLPLRDAIDLNELLEWDKILTMLTKRLYEIEKFDKDRDDKMHKEIVKWVVRFPLLQGQEINIDKFANDLQNRLKVSKENRRCVTRFSKGKQLTKNKKPKESPRNINQIAGPSNEGQNWISPTSNSQSHCQLSSEPQKKPTELVLEIVEQWCNLLPLPHVTPQDGINNKIIKDNLFTQIIIKICTLNGNPQTFNDDILYEYCMDGELENLLSKVPICCNFDNVKNSLIPQLIKGIISILPLMREEKACYEYKNELKTTINHVLQEPLNTTAEKIAMFNKLKDEIIDNYVQYHYNREDDDLKQIYKDNLHEVVEKYLQNIRNKSDYYSVNPLMKENQLICELAKVPIPCERVIKEEVEVIKMKEEVNNFFDSLGLPEESEDKMTLRNNIKFSLSKRLNDIEQTNQSSQNDSKMKKEIQRYLKKMDLEIAPEKIDAFVKKLKDNEAIRKAPPVTNKSIIQPSTDKLQLMANLYVPNTMEKCSFQECSDDRHILSGASECRHIGEGSPLNSSPVYNETQQQQLYNHIPTSNPTADASQNQQHSSSQSQRHALGQNTVKFGLNEDEADHEACICELQTNHKFKRRPRCIFRLEDYCEEYCDQFRHMWMPMPYRMPPPGYFYY
ncbi:unnamed protein product [Diatraea saccharalis]|uniref:Uncharacterized protein n=1 Tax=Diatraea saccharalis TaxID=40085 RepID=A0A9N9RCR7_9NEOP|nr:unnamed protein product [Diatraea saccharalis]